MMWLIIKILDSYESTHNQGVAQRITDQISKEHEEYTLREVKS